MGQTPYLDQEEGYHRPVMLRKVTEILSAAPPGLVVDATFGGGGHSRALLLSRPNDPMLAIDQDPDAIANVPADNALGEGRLQFVSANFGELSHVLEGLPEMGRRGSEPIGRDHTPHESDADTGHGHGVAGVLFDLGVSSHQLDVAERGFSYRQPGPLDMRMDSRGGLTAEDIVNHYGADELIRIFRKWGEERHARRIATRIVAERPITDTAQLASVVAAATPAADRRKRHPARKVFQALRIEVNDEIGALARGLDAAITSLSPEGRVVVISYHSIEDRLVKRRFAAGATGCTCPPDLPVCACGGTAELRLLTRGGLRPTTDEVAVNRRARSALLRAAAKVGP